MVCPHRGKAPGDWRTPRRFAHAGAVGSAKAPVGRAVLCAPLAANGRVRVCHGGAHGVTRPTFAPASGNAATLRRFGKKLQNNLLLFTGGGHIPVKA
jgi:hypothetical protein